MDRMEGPGIQDTLTNKSIHMMAQSALAMAFFERFPPPLLSPSPWHWQDKFQTTPTHRQSREHRNFSSKSNGWASSVHYEAHGNDLFWFFFLISLWCLFGCSFYFRLSLSEKKRPPETPLSNLWMQCCAWALIHLKPKITAEPDCPGWNCLKCVRHTSKKSPNWQSETAS